LLVEVGKDKRYFDSFGLTLPTELDNYLGGDVFYPTQTVQRRDKVFCSHLCLFVLRQMQNEKGLQGMIVFGDIINASR